MYPAALINLVDSFDRLTDREIDHFCSIMHQELQKAKKAELTIEDMSAILMNTVREAQATMMQKLSN